MNVERYINKLVTDPGTGCMQWTGALTSNGYAKVRVMNKPYRLHREVYKHFKGPIQSGMVIDHVCNNRRCCNPDHLRQLSNKDNILRGIGVAAVNAKKTHCKNGHELIGYNLRIKHRSSGIVERVCRVCHRGSA